MSDLTGKVAIITGGLGGIGSAAAALFAKKGAAVMITDRVPEREITARSLGDNVRFQHHDVVKAEDWERVVAETERAFGPVSVLLNNAGVVGDSSAVQDCTEETFRQVQDINQVGVFLGMRAVVPSMQRAGGGAIVNTSSAAGLVAAASTFAYVTSKFAVNGMTKAAALDLGRFKIRVNSVHPGLIETAMTRTAPEHVRATFAATAQALPAGRLGQPEEVAELMAYLASDASSFCTGGSFVVDGGWTVS